MPKVKQLSEAEKDYVRAHHGDMSVKELAGKLSNGIGQKAVQEFINSAVLPEATADQTPQERHQQLQEKTGLTAGKLMGRDPERGIAVMTSGASELSDARRALQSKAPKQTAKSQPERIFIMDKNKDVY